MGELSHLFNDILKFLKIGIAESGPKSANRNNSVGKVNIGPDPIYT